MKEQGMKNKKAFAELSSFLSKKEENFLTIVTLTRFLKIILNHVVN